MTEQVVCDSTVAVRWFLEQVGYEAARDVLDRALAGEVALIAPSVILWETGNVLLKFGVRTGLLSVDDLVSAVTVVHDVCTELVDVEPTRLGALAFELNTSFFDAAFAALALERRLTVVTADVRFARAVAGRISTELLAGVGLSTDPGEQSKS